MKKIIMLLLLIVLGFSFTKAYYSSDLVDKCCIISYIDYQSKLDQVSQVLSTKYPAEKRYLDNLIFKVVGIISRNYANKKVYAYNKIADTLVNYVYDNNICKWTKAYYKFAYLTYTFKYYADYFKKKNKVDSFLENLASN